MKKIGLILAISISTFMLTACGKNEIGTINDLSFEIPKAFSKCEKTESQYSCVYKENNNFCSINISSAVPLSETDPRKAVENLLFLNGDIEVEYSQKEINGNIWTTGYVDNDGNEFQKMLYLINDYNGNRYEVSYDCSLDADMSDENFQVFENSLNFK